MFMSELSAVNPSCVPIHAQKPSRNKTALISKNKQRSHRYIMHHYSSLVMQMEIIFRCSEPRRADINSVGTSHLFFFLFFYFQAGTFCQTSTSWIFRLLHCFFLYVQQGEVLQISPASVHRAPVKASTEQENAERSTGMHHRLKWAQAGCPGCRKCPLSHGTNLMYDCSFCTGANAEKRNYWTILKPQHRFWALFHLVHLLDRFCLKAFAEDRNLEDGLLHFL